MKDFIPNQVHYVVLLSLGCESYLSKKWIPSCAAWNKACSSNILWGEKSKGMAYLANFLSEQKLAQSGFRISFKSCFAKIKINSSSDMIWDKRDGNNGAEKWNRTKNWIGDKNFAVLAPEASDALKTWKTLGSSNSIEQSTDCGD